MPGSIDGELYIGDPGFFLQAQNLHVAKVPIAKVIYGKKILTNFIYLKFFRRDYRMKIFL